MRKPFISRNLNMFSKFTIALVIVAGATADSDTLLRSNAVVPASTGPIDPEAETAGAASGAASGAACADFDGTWASHRVFSEERPDVQTLTQRKDECAGTSSEGWAFTVAGNTATVTGAMVGMPLGSVTTFTIDSVKPVDPDSRPSLASLLGRELPFEPTRPPPAHAGAVACDDFTGMWKTNHGERLSGRFAPSPIYNMFSQGGCDGVSLEGREEVWNFIVEGNQATVTDGFPRGLLKGSTTTFKLDALEEMPANQIRKRL